MSSIHSMPISKPVPDQPFTDGDVVEMLSNQEFASLGVPERSDVREEAVEVIYGVYEDVGCLDEFCVNPRDDQHAERLVDITEAESDDYAYLVTTTLEPGDTFTFEYRDGEWEYVGTHKKHDSRILFEPADVVASNSPLAGEYYGFHRGDFARKFSNAISSSIHRVTNDDTTDETDDQDAAPGPESDCDAPASDDGEQAQPDEESSASIRARIRAWSRRLIDRLKDTANWDSFNNS